MCLIKQQHIQHYTVNHKHMGKIKHILHYFGLTYSLYEIALMMKQKKSHLLVTATGSILKIPWKDMPKESGNCCSRQHWSFFFFNYYACSIIISNITCFVGLHSYLFSKIAYLLYAQIYVSFACYFIFYEFSRCMLPTNLLKILVYLLIRISLLMGQFSVRNISAFNLTLSCFTRSQSYNIWSLILYDNPIPIWKHYVYKCKHHNWEWRVKHHL